VNRAKNQSPKKSALPESKQLPEPKIHYDLLPHPQSIPKDID
jgi:hypothetical protein